MITLLERYDTTIVYDDPNDPRAGRDVTTYVIYRFDEISRTVSQEGGSYDGSPPANYSFVGEFFAGCDGTTLNHYTHNGAGGFTVRGDADSLSCGYVPPTVLTCDLVLADVVVSTAPDGTTTAEVPATGAHGRVHYRLDGGPEQTSRFFYDVAPGPHLVAVRDDGLVNCRRTRAFVVAAAPAVQAPAGAPAGVDLVAQPLWHRTPAPAGATVHVELYAERTHGADDFALVFTARQQATATGVVATRLDTLLLPLLRAFAPPTGRAADQVQVCRTNLVNYFVRTAVRVPGRAATYATGPLRTALRGALPAEWRGLDYFTYRLDAYDQPPFLSWAPAGQALTPTQPGWLFWLCPGDQPTALTVRRRYVRTGFAQGAPLVEDEVLDLRGGRGPKHRLLAIPIKPRAGMDAVSVGLYDAQDAPLSPELRFSLVAETPRSRYLSFTNSFGCLDTLRTEGKLEETLEGTATLVERPAQAGDAAGAPEQLTTDVTATRKLKLAIGWRTAAELAWVQELVLAPEIWLHHPRLGPLPLKLAKRSLALPGDEGGLRGMSLEFDYAFAPTAIARF
jgi:hypothetical protein